MDTSFALLSDRTAPQRIATARSQTQRATCQPGGPRARQSDMLGAKDWCHPAPSTPRTVAQTSGHGQVDFRRLRTLKKSLWYA